MQRLLGAAHEVKGPGHTSMLTEETKRRINACRDVLVGKLPLPTDQVELITLALIYKFMDDLDQESVDLGGKRSFFKGDLARYRWRNLLPQSVSAEERVTLFSGGIEALGDPKRAAHLPGLFRDIFRNAFLKFRDGRILTMFLQEIDGFAYSHSEELGNAFEYLLQCMGTQGENGQFRTPRHIIDFMVACLDPQPADRILDPACGTGGFLVSAYKHILKQHTSPGARVPGDRLTHARRQQVYKNLHGYDVTDLMVKLSKVNLFLHGFPDPDIHIYDTLSNDARWNEKADLILANPPFMTPKGGVTPHAKFRIAAKKAEVLFTDYIAEHLTPEGRGGVIVPNGIVATTQNAYVQLRRFLVEDSLVAVVSLPAGVFKPYSGVKTSILFLDKKLARQRKEILFLKVTADGFDLGDQRRVIESNDLPEAERVVREWLKGLPIAECRLPNGGGVVWRAVEKADLLAHRSVGLQAEPFLGGAAVEHIVDVAAIADVVEINPKKAEVRDLDPGTLVSFVPMEDLKTDRPDFAVTCERPIGEVLTGYTYFRDRDVLLAKITPCFENGKAGVARGLRNGIGFGSSEYYVLRCGDRVVPEFLYRFITRPAFREEGEKNMSGTGGQQRVARDFLAGYEIPLPPLEEQRRIVVEIEGYQKVLDGARQILAGGETRIIVEADWQTVSFEALCGRMQYGLSVPLNEDGRGVKTFRMAELVRGRAVDNGSMKCADIAKSEATKYRLVKGDLLFNRTNSFEHVGRTGIFDLDGDYVFASYLLRLIIRRDLAEPAFVNAWMNTREFQTGVKSLASRAVGQSNISASSLAGYEIPLPPLDEQRRIVAELEAEAAQIEAVRGLIPRYEAKIQRVLDRVWGTAKG